MSDVEIAIWLASLVPSASLVYIVLVLDRAWDASLAGDLFKLDLHVKTSLLSDDITSEPLSPDDQILDICIQSDIWKMVMRNPVSDVEIAIYVAKLGFPHSRLYAFSSNSDNIVYHPP